MFSDTFAGIEPASVLDDPAGQGLEMVRGVRDEIKQRIQALVQDLTG
jgi:hypothetical protein